MPRTRPSARSLVAFLLLAASGALAQPPGPAAAPAAEAPAQAMPGDDDGAATFAQGVPAALEVKRANTGHLLVRPSINGHRPGWFIFDTGAGIDVLDPELADGLGLHDAGGVDASGMGGITPSRLRRADLMELGPMRLPRHTLMLADLKFLTPHTGERIAGVVGYGVLSRCIAEFDLSAATIQLLDPAAYSLPRGEWKELLLIERLPAIHGSIEGHDAILRLDTGDNGHLAIHQHAVERWKLLEGRETTPIGVGGVGGVASARRGVIRTLQFAGRSLTDVPTNFATTTKGALAAKNKDGALGAKVLTMPLVFDYAGRRIAFLPEAQTGGKAPDAASARP